MPDERLVKAQEIFDLWKEKGDIEAYAAALSDPEVKRILTNWVLDIRRMEAGETTGTQAAVFWAKYRISDGRYRGGRATVEQPPSEPEYVSEVVTDFNFNVISSEYGEENPAYTPIRDPATATWRDSTQQEIDAFKLEDAQGESQVFSHEVDRRLSEKIGFTFHGKRFPLNAETVRDILFAIAAFDQPGHVHAFITDVTGEDFQIDSKSLAEHLLQHAVKAYWQFREVGTSIRTAIAKAADLVELEQVRDKRLD